MRDCSSLIKKITARITCWSSKLLSYAGRVQLIKSVLFSMQNYWCRNFLLPKGVLNKVNQMCAGFLWKGKAFTAKGARVNWKDVCHPRSEGGLGLKDMASWNKACIMQNIWAIICKAGSIWIAWVEAYMLKGRDFWQVSASNNSSWNWRKLLQLRTEVLQFVTWTNGRASWGFPGNKYRAAVVWQVIRHKKEKVEWHKLIWGALVVPKHATIAWMAMLNRLPTKDRIKSWGLEVDGKCVLCGGEEETRDHLFHGCTFSRQLWGKIMEISGHSRAMTSWSGEFQWMIQKCKGKSLVSIILRLAWQALIYYIWIERNNRIYKGREKTVVQILEQIKEVVSIRTKGLKKVKLDSVNFTLYSSWNLSQIIFV